MSAPPETMLLERVRAVGAPGQLLAVFERVSRDVATIRSKSGDAAADRAFRGAANALAAAIENSMHATGALVPISRGDRRVMDDLVRVIREALGSAAADVSHDVVVDQGVDVTVTTRVARHSSGSEMQVPDFTSRIGPDDVLDAARKLSRGEGSDGRSAAE